MRDVAVKAMKADEQIAQSTFWNQWRDPWNEINAKVSPVLDELGYTHVAVKSDSKCFATLPDRVLAALNELRVLRQEKADGKL